MKSEDYLKKLTRTIRDRKVKAGISNELKDCIDDLKESYMELGFSAEDAETRAVAHMGSPEETGKLFNCVYRPKWEWRAAAYMLLWAGIMSLVKYVSIFDAADQIGLIGYKVAGVAFLLSGMLISVIEIHNELPFLWWHEAPARNWCMKGLGVFGNSSAIAGLGIGAISESFTEFIMLYGITSIIILLQRAYGVEWRNKKEQRYLWEVGTAMEKFDFIGKAELGGKKQKVQLRKGAIAEKGDSLIVVGISGMTLLVEPV